VKVSRKIASVPNCPVPAAHRSPCASKTMPGDRKTNRGSAARGTPLTLGKRSRYGGRSRSSRAAPRLSQLLGRRPPPPLPTWQKGDAVMIVSMQVTRCPGRGCDHAVERRRTHLQAAPSASQAVDADAVELSRTRRRMPRINRQRSISSSHVRVCGRFCQREWNDRMKVVIQKNACLLLVIFCCMVIYET